MECIFANIALYFEFLFNKNSGVTYQGFFPAGKIYLPTVPVLRKGIEWHQTCERSQYEAGVWSRQRGDRTTSVRAVSPVTPVKKQSPNLNGQ